MARIGRLLALVACALALAGCASLADLAELRATIEDAGYDVHTLDHQTTNGHDELAIGATTSDDTPTDDAAWQVAEIVWDNYPNEVDELVVALDGQRALVASGEDLRSRFGDRPDQLGVVQGDDSNVGTIIVILSCAAVLAVIFVVVWRVGKRAPAPAVPMRPYSPGGFYPGPRQPYPPGAPYGAQRAYPAGQPYAPPPPYGHPDGQPPYGPPTRTAPPAPPPTAASGPTDEPTTETTVGSPAEPTAMPPAEPAAVPPAERPGSTSSDPGTPEQAASPGTRSDPHPPTA